MADFDFNNVSSSKTVRVRDTSGHLGFSLILRLLLRGYAVHAAVQHHDAIRNAFVLFIQWSREEVNIGR
ncbi:Cinnamoyl-CoA reductase-like protein [Melia azedarach]|uniref:Cinnamoyl-CoA reductase-like protein n=1 Tax=Melia azedarach TaxID=155640 RepID=A0ACC1XRQ0_MELAZ|nr:Cinnamoyl-CoA reductase-like protein [Melia azedarach]